MFIFWYEIPGAFHEKKVASLKSLGKATITHSTGCGGPLKFTVSLIKKGGIYPHTVKSFSTEGECFDFVENYVKNRVAEYTVVR